MAQFKVKVPPTQDQGNFVFNITTSPNETAPQAALWHYNSARAHDGLDPIKRMPIGTQYIRQYEYVVQQYAGRQYGWEDVCSSENRKEALADVKAYRENQPEYPVRIKRRPL